MVARRTSEPIELFAQQVGLLIVDVQQKLASSMPEKVLKGTLRNWLNLIESARVLDLPVVVSEQNPAVLGRALPVVGESVLRLPQDSVFSFEKTQFGVCGVDAFDRIHAQIKRPQWILCGMEAHVAVYHSARGLVKAGCAVHIARDAVISRTMANWEIGLNLAEQAGATISSTEAIVFDLLKRSNSDAFRSLSKIVR